MRNLFCASIIAVLLTESAAAADNIVIGAPMALTGP